MTHTATSTACKRIVSKKNRYADTRQTQIHKVSKMQRTHNKKKKSEKKESPTLSSRIFWFVIVVAVVFVVDKDGFFKFIFSQNRRYSMHTDIIFIIQLPSCSFFIHTFIIIIICLCVNARIELNEQHM